MYSGFMHKKVNAQVVREEKQKAKANRAALSTDDKVDLYTSQSVARTNQWIHQNANTKTASILSQGSTMLIHPEHHQFRDYSPLGSVYVRKY